MNQNKRAKIVGNLIKLGGAAILFTVAGGLVYNYIAA